MSVGCSLTSKWFGVAAVFRLGGTFSLLYGVPSAVVRFFICSPGVWRSRYTRDKKACCSTFKSISGASFGNLAIMAPCRRAVRIQAYGAA